MLSPSGEQFQLVQGEMRATITEVGASLRQVMYRGRELVRGYAEDTIAPVYSGAVLAPWPNRVRDGRFVFSGKHHQLPVTEPERDTALHGLVLWEPWSVLARSRSAVTLGYRLFPQPGYPFMLRLEASYQLTEGGLRIGLTAINNGAEPAPYGCSIHPYLVAGEGAVDDWTLHLSAATVLEVDPERLLPEARRPAASLDLDFTRPRRIGPVQADHAFTDLSWEEGERARATLVADDGHGVVAEWGNSCPWVQVHTADHPEPALHRTALALEPMTCPPDAFNSGEDLVVLQPGEDHHAWWSMAPFSR